MIWPNQAFAARCAPLKTGFHHQVVQSRPSAATTLISLPSAYRPGLGRLARAPSRQRRCAVCRSGRLPGLDDDRRQVVVGLLLRAQSLRVLLNSAPAPLRRLAHRSLVRAGDSLTVDKPRPKTSDTHRHGIRCTSATKRRRVGGKPASSHDESERPRSQIATSDFLWPGTKLLVLRVAPAPGGMSKLLKFASAASNDDQRDPTFRTSSGRSRMLERSKTTQGIRSSSNASRAFVDG